MAYYFVAGELSSAFGVPVYCFDFLNGPKTTKTLSTLSLFKMGDREYCGEFPRDLGKEMMKEKGALCLSETDCYMYYVLAGEVDIRTSHQTPLPELLTE